MEIETNRQRIVHIKWVEIYLMNITVSTYRIPIDSARDNYINIELVLLACFRVGLRLARSQWFSIWTIRWLHDNL